MENSKNNNLFQFPEEHKAAVEHALMFIPPFSSSDESHVWYSKILRALTSNYGLDTARELLSKNIEAKYLSDLLESCLPLDTEEPTDCVYEKAIEFGWSLEKFFKDKNKDLGDIHYKDLPVPERANFIVNARYLTMVEELKNLSEKNLIIHSSHGTGKTEFVINQLKDKQFIYITHRELLAREVHSRIKAAGIEVELYKDLSPIAMEHLEASLVICINSIHKLEKDFFEGKHVVIDEFDQFVNHIYGDTCSKDLASIYSKLVYLFSKSEGSIFLSADFPDVALKFLKSVLKIRKWYYVFNKYIPNQGRSLTIHKTAESILSHIVDTLDTGEKVSIASFSKQKVEDLARALNDIYGDSKKIIYIVQDNKKFKEQAALLNDKGLAKYYDAILYSPVLSSGVDFNIEFSRVNYLLVNENVPIDHVEAIQMAHRFRKFSELHVHCDRQFLPKQKVEKENSKSWKESIKMHKLYAEVIENEKVKKKPKGIFAFLTNFFLNEKYKNNLLRYFYVNLIFGLERRGYIVDFTEFSAKDSADKVKTVLKFYCPAKKVKKRKSELLREVEKALTFEKVMSLPKITLGQHWRIKYSGPTSYLEQQQLIAWEIKESISFIEGDVESKQDLELYFKGKYSIKKFLGQKRNFALLMDKEFLWDTSELDDIKRAKQNILYSLSVKTKLLKEIWELIPSFNFKGEHLEEVLSYMKKNEENIDLHLFSLEAIYFIDPVRFLSKCLDLCGLKFKSKQTTGLRTAAYWINEEYVAFMERTFLRKKQSMNGRESA